VHQLYVLATLTPEYQVPIEREAGRTPEPVWMLWRREESRTSARIWTLGIPTWHLVTILTELPHLHLQST